MGTREDWQNTTLPTAACYRCTLARSTAAGVVGRHEYLEDARDRGEFIALLDLELLHFNHFRNLISYTSPSSSAAAGSKIDSIHSRR